MFLLLLLISGGLTAYNVRQSREVFYGWPISVNAQRFLGKVFHPQAFVRTRYDIVLCDDDEKFYSLRGIVLDGMTFQQLVLQTNASFSVYKTNDQLHLRKETGNGWF